LIVACAVWALVLPDVGFAFARPVLNDFCSFTSCDSSGPLLVADEGELWIEVENKTNSSVYLLVFSSEEGSIGDEHYVFDLVAAMNPTALFVKIEATSDSRFLPEFLIFGVPSIVLINDSTLKSWFTGNPSNSGEVGSWVELHENVTAVRVDSPSVPRSPVPLSRWKRLVLPNWLPYLCAGFSLIYAIHSVVKESMNALRWLRS